MSEVLNWPPQQLPFSRKTKEWRKKHLDWADQKSFFNYSLVRKSVIHKKINYDLLNGKLHMNDLELILNPDSIKAGFIPDRVQHYPIMNSKLNVLRGEEAKRIFDYKVIVTNPNSVADIERTRKEELLNELQQAIQNTAASEEEFNAELERLNDYYTYEWQDFREIRANALLNHYAKQYNIPKIFNDGFMDALTVSEEIYQCDINGGEPTIERVNPLKIRIYKSGYSNRIEDADMIVIEDYWSPGRVYDTFGDVLTKKDMEYLEKIPDHIGQAQTDSMNNIDDRLGFVNNFMIGDEITQTDGFFWDPFGSTDGVSNSLLPYDLAGNVRVLRVYWKSRRRIKKVKSYDPDTGEEKFTFYPETYVTNKDMGEEEQIFYINEAWEGTKIGTEIYVNMRPRVVQYNSLSNPSRCHFGIVGSIYNLNDSRPFSLVDMMKPYNYMYDVVFDKLTKLMSHNWGKLVNLDLAKVPKGWDVEKWLYFAKTNNLAIVDSFKEGNIGAATGKLAGALNNANSGVIDASFGNEIQFNISLLEFLKGEMGEVAGISKQREGQVSNRETVGGVERATLQSSYITEWLFYTHDDTKRRALEAFLETAKIALKGRNKKFQYILPDYAVKMVDIDGDEFAESDYGLVVDNSTKLQELDQKLDMLAQAAIQNQYQLSVITKLYSSMSIAEKTRMLETYEAKMQQQQQQELQVKQQEIQQNAQAQEREQQLKDALNQRDNETKVIVAEINAQANMYNADSKEYDDGINPMSEGEREKFRESIRQFDAKLKLERDKFDYDKVKTKKDQELKLKQINSKTTSISK